MWRFNKTIVECTTTFDDFVIKNQAVKYVQVYDYFFQSLEPNDLEVVQPEISSKFSYNSSCSFPHALLQFPNHAHVEKAIPIVNKKGQARKEKKCESSISFIQVNIL
jgi:hypothetical protein